MKKFVSLVLTLVLSMSIMSIPASAIWETESPTGNEGNIFNVIFDDGIQAKQNRPAANDVVTGETILTNTPTNGEGRIDRIVVVDLDATPLASYEEYELPANTAVFFAAEAISSIDMSVDYVPSNLDLYYGIGTKSDGTGNHWANKATGGSGSASICPDNNRCRNYYPYLANGNSKTMYVDFSYSATCWISLDDMADETRASMELAYSDLHTAPVSMQDSILTAREEIIYSQSWTVDGQCVLICPDGTVEELPEFYDLFPSDWDIPASAVDSVDITPYTGEIFYSGEIRLPQKTDALATPFFRFAGNGSLVRMQITQLPVSYCNMGFTNLTLNEDAGFVTGKREGYILGISSSPRYTYGARASVDGDAVYAHARVWG